MLIFMLKKCYIFLNFVQKFDCGYTLEPPLKSTHNLCFCEKYIKLFTPMNPSFTTNTVPEGVSVVMRGPENFFA